MKTRSADLHEPAEMEIQHAAYFLWEELGRPEGRDLEIWLTARERLRHQAHFSKGDRSPATLPRRAARPAVPPKGRLLRPPAR